MIFIGILVIVSIIAILTRKEDINVPYSDNKIVKLKTNMNLPSKKYHGRKIEGVIICVNYADFLRWTLPYNKGIFDYLVVVTDTNDIETQKLCEYWSVHCVKTDIFYSDGDGFNKAKGINYGLSFLSNSDWVIHMDADIFLPPRTREILQITELNESSLYGIDRLNCKSFTEWIMYLENPEVQHGNDGLLKQNIFDNGDRLINLQRDGWVPMGYFQMWNPNGSGVYYYPTEHQFADRTDILFAYQFSRVNRNLFPDIVAIHLQTDDNEMGINWKGRKSKYFGLKNSYERSDN